MSMREWSGLALIAIGIAIAPFAYWVGFGWTLLALVPLALGSTLIYTARVKRRLQDSSALRDDSGPDVPFGAHELKGFHGASVLGRDGDVDD